MLRITLLCKPLAVYLLKVAAVIPPIMPKTAAMSTTWA